jgi:hypothetical protein
MEVFALSVICPICKTSRTTSVFGQRDVRVTQQGVTKTVGAELAAFRCEPAGHVFFVLVSDLRTAGMAGSDQEPQTWGT